MDYNVFVVDSSIWPMNAYVTCWKYKNSQTILYSKNTICFLHIVFHLFICDFRFVQTHINKQNEFFYDYIDVKKIENKKKAKTKQVEKNVCIR